MQECRMRSTGSAERRAAHATSMNALRVYWRFFFFENRSQYPPMSSFSINSIPARSKAA